jgi:ribosome-binding ATPase YchF (GTP1/OBG family)
MMIGLVGKPSSGKSSFFKAATMTDVKISPVPFTTIQPNLGLAYVIIDCVDRNFGLKCNPRSGSCLDGKRFVPVKLIDVAGLVPGAHDGRGLGNKFLDDLRQADALIHVVDASGQTDEEGNPTTGHEPMRDVEFLEREIDWWIHSILEKAAPKISKLKSDSEILQVLSDQLSGLGISRIEIEETLQKIENPLSIEFATALRAKSKPIIVAANKCDIDSAKENSRKLAEAIGAIPTSAEAEIVLKKAAEKGMIKYLPGSDFEIIGGLDEKQRHALDIIRQKVITPYGSTGIQKCLDKAIFQTLGCIAVYPVTNSNKMSDKEGRVLPDVHLVPKGTTVRELAFRIHTSIGEKFIAGIDARTKKKLSADYVLQDKDVVEIMFSK